MTLSQLLSRLCGKTAANPQCSREVLELTEGVRIDETDTTVLYRGFCINIFRSWRDDGSTIDVPCLFIAEAREKLFELFMTLLHLVEKDSALVDVVLESNHDGGEKSVDLWSEGMELITLKSVLWDFEEMLLDDGCASVSVRVPPFRAPAKIELRFDQDGLLYVFTPFEGILQRFIQVLRDEGVPQWKHLDTLLNVKHDHVTTSHFQEEFNLLCERIGASKDDYWE